MFKYIDYRITLMKDETNCQTRRFKLDPMINFTLLLLDLTIVYYLIGLIASRYILWRLGHRVSVYAKSVWKKSLMSKSMDYSATYPLSDFGFLPLHSKYACLAEKANDPPNIVTWIDIFW